jgi:hypothetical protein
VSELCDDLEKPDRIFDTDWGAEFRGGESVFVGVVECIPELEPSSWSREHILLACMRMEMLERPPHSLGPVGAVVTMAALLTVLLGPHLWVGIMHIQAVLQATRENIGWEGKGTRRQARKTGHRERTGLTVMLQLISARRFQVEFIQKS